MGNHVQHEGDRLPVRAVVVTVGLLLLALVGLRAVGAAGGSGPEARNEGRACGARILQVSVAPRIEPLVGRALESIEEKTCVGFDIDIQPEREAVDAVFFGGEAPDLWIPDGDWNVPKLPVDVVSPALASTPVLLAGGPEARPVTSWADAMTDGGIVMPDPLVDSVGALAMLAPRQEAKVARADLEVARAFLVPTAQAYGEVIAEGGGIDASLESLSPESTQLMAATEADLLALDETMDWVRPVIPDAGAALMRFPLVVRDDASSLVRAVANRLEAWFSSDQGLLALRQAGLRRGDGRSAMQGIGLGDLRYLPTPRRAAVNDYRSTWEVMSVPSSVLAVIDVSGSMDFTTTTGTTRIKVATQAAETALELFPDHARVGLWVFSIDQGGPGQDWRVMEPLRRLDASVDGSTHRALLAAHAPEAAELTSGGTGLYDAALAAYRQAVASYSPDYANSVILITDGANDDPGSISDRKLLRELSGLADPERPVRLIGIGISKDADMAALHRIAEATGGRAHRADAPEDIGQVFAQEIAGR